MNLACSLHPSIPTNWGRPRDFMLLTHHLSLFKLPKCSAEIDLCIFSEMLEQKFIYKNTLYYLYICFIWVI